MKRIARGSTTQLAVLFGLATFFVPQLAFGIVPNVKTVPWDPTNFANPHFAYAGKLITLKGTSDQQGANFAYDWDPGDGGAHCTGTVTNQYVVQCTHTYAGAVGTTWTAVLKVTDTNTGDNASSNYPVLMAANNLTSNVNVAIDDGLWYLHSNMSRYVVGPLNEGDWSTNSTGFANFANVYGVTATNLQAFEVNGHLESGPAGDPYTDDVARGLKALIAHLTTLAVSSFTVPGGCGAPPCPINPDGNGNGLGIYLSDGTGQYEYQSGMVIDAIVASGTPTAVAVTGPANVTGKTYKTIVQDMVDQYVYCTYHFNPGGSWVYGCNQGIDNSVSQWAAIGIIAGVRGFGVSVDPNLYGWNKVWLGNSEAANGVFGYNSTSPVWGPYATTPSGMVQLAMDAVGRGDSRWDHSETFIRDNFGNPPTNSNVSIKAYYYGLFSFTKSMLLHDPGGVLTPITLLQSATPGVTPLDWYAAEAALGAPTDGVARWLVGQQNPTGYWYNQLEINTSNQWPFSTGFAIIMLRRTVFTACVTDLGGRGTASGRAPARIDLTWSALPNADHYTVLRGTTTGGPYSPVGTATITAFSDTSGLSNGGTYYYVLQPDNSAGGEICQSPEAKITVPAAGR
jgi:hypothetical protein